MKEEASFSRYGKNFQEGLCQLILQDRPFCDQMSEILDINFLELGYLQVFIKKIFDYKQKYAVHPTYKIMTTILRSDLDDENEATKKQVRDYFVRIYNQDVDGTEYIKETALDFCKKQVLKKAILRSVKLLKNSSYDEIASEINNALKLGMDNDYGYDYLKDFEQRFQIKARNAITTGWKEIDTLCKDGLGKGELGVVIAPTGAGKSMVLVHLGAEAVKAGKTVVHYTLELADTTIGSRYDSCITGVPLSDLFSFKEMIYDTLQEIEGSLIVKEYPTKTASSQTIRNHLDKLKQRDIKPDMIIVDYGDLLKATTVYKEKRMNLESIYEELRAIAQEHECPIWTASQTNRSGLNAEVITMESISEAFNKCFVADFIFSVSRTAEDKSANTGRLFVAKNRNGPDGLVYPLHMDTSTVNIRVLPSTGDTPEQMMAKTAKQQADTLREKYKNFKNSKRDTNGRI
tara:strand:+ start:1261 stop:2640 length:1380 start_codon:yes stop_codon:yes gene_type:complete